MTRLPALLDQLDHAWRALGCPVDGLFAPGLTESQVRTGLSAVTDRPSREVIEWFSWHNGPRDLSTSVIAYPIGFELLSLERAPAQRAQRLELAESLAHDVADLPAAFYWKPTWYPIGDAFYGATLALDIVSDPDTCAVYNVIWDDHSFQEPIATSLAEVIEFCLEALGSGLFEWSENPRPEWVYDFAATPLEWRRKRIF